MSLSYKILNCLIYFRLTTLNNRRNFRLNSIFISYNINLCSYIICIINASRIYFNLNSPYSREDGGRNITQTEVKAEAKPPN